MVFIEGIDVVHHVAIAVAEGDCKFWLPSPKPKEIVTMSLLPWPRVISIVRTNGQDRNRQLPLPRVIVFPPTSGTKDDAEVTVSPAPLPRVIVLCSLE